MMIINQQVTLTLTSLLEGALAIASMRLVLSLLAAASVLTYHR